jgi:phosphoribosylamine-glycine ligase
MAIEKRWAHAVIYEKARQLAAGKGVIICLSSPG